jgi:hypothetical protein
MEANKKAKKLRPRVARVKFMLAIKRLVNDSRRKSWSWVLRENVGR